MLSDIQQALTNALLKLLYPLVRVLLRNGVSYGVFAELARKIYVDVAFREFRQQGRDDIGLLAEMVMQVARAYVDLIGNFIRGRIRLTVLIEQQQASHKDSCSSVATH